MRANKQLTESVSSVRQSTDGLTVSYRNRQSSVSWSEPSVGPSVELVLASFPGSEIVTDVELQLARQARFAVEWNDWQRVSSRNVSDESAGGH